MKRLLLAIAATAALASSLGAAETYSDAEIDTKLEELQKGLQTKFFGAEPSYADLAAEAKAIQDLIDQAEDPASQSVFMARILNLQLAAATGAGPESVELLKALLPTVEEKPIRSQIAAFVASSAAQNGDNDTLDAVAAIIAEGDFDEELAVRIEGLRINASLVAGNAFPDFEATDTTGKAFKLSDYKGKVVLIDFWATWCGPCVAEMPNVIKAYETYADKGFDVIAISLDQDKAALDSYVEQNNIPWRQVFDGKGWQADLAQRFGISSIPATYLIGPDGVILGNALRGEALDEAIAAALGESGEQEATQQ